MNLTETDLCQLNLLFRNNHFGFFASTSSPARVCSKAKINGTSIFSRENRRVKRRNSFTVSFTKTVLDDGPYYCVVEKFVSVCGQNVAFITELAITRVLTKKMKILTVQVLSHKLVVHLRIVTTVVKVW